MPIYEFRCNSCGRKTSVFTQSVSSALDPKCSSCGGRDLTRCISSFAFHRSEQSILEEMGEPAAHPTDPGYYKDPRMIGRWAEKRLNDMGVDMRSEENRDTFGHVTEMIDAAREGEMPPAMKDL